MRAHSIPFIAAMAGALLVMASGCTKSSDPAAAGAAPAPSTSGGAASSASAPPAAPQVAAATGAPSGTSLEGFEGGLVMHTTTARGVRDALFITKGGLLRVDVPEPDGRTAHTIFDPAGPRLMVILDSQHLVLQMPPPSAAPGDASKPPTITRTGKHETVAGYDCEDWEIAEEAGGHQSTCVAQGLPFFDFSATAGATGGHSWAEELRDKHAFPLRAHDVDASGKDISRMEVTRIEKRPVDDSAFIAPPGFNVMSVPGVVGAQGAPVRDR